MFAKRVRTLYPLVCLLAAVLSPPAWAEDENPGLPDLDKATQLKISAEGLADLNDVIDHLESAIEKGLDDENRQFAEDVLVATLMQRAATLSSAILDQPARQRDPRWMQIRQFALADLERVLTLDEQFWGAHLLLGRLQALPSGDHDAARQSLEKVADAAQVADDDRAQALAALATLEEGQERQEEMFARAIELQPDKPDYYRVRAQFYYGESQFEQALADIDRALDIEPDHAASQELRGLILLGLDRFDEALETFNKASELAPDAVLPYQHRGEVYRRQGDLEKAVQQLSKALEIVPNDVATLVLRASLHFQLNDTAQALEDAEKAIQLQPQLLVPHLLRAEILAATQRFDEAIQQLEELVPRAPQEPKLLEPLATFYLIEGQSDDAIETFTTLIEIDPENARALRFRGDAYLNIGDHRKAIDDFNRALELSHDDDGLLNNMAWVLATSPDDDVRDGPRAVELANKAAELTSFQVPHILSTLAAACAETGDFESAIKWSEKAVELAEDDSTREQLEKELASYQQGQPWRERQTQAESAGDSTSSDRSPEAAPTSATIPARSPSRDP